jgi:hypothetical protein
MKPDVDLDFGDRNQILNLIQYTSALIIRDGKRIRHNTGIYVTAIPQDILNETASIDFKEAEDLGYFKLDLFKLVNSPEHLEELLSRPTNWKLLNNPELVSQLIHIGKYYSTIQKLPEPIDSNEKLMMFLALIRPGKKHLMGLKWDEVRKTIWLKEDTGYTFKKSHAASYQILVCLHMKLLEEKL